MTKTNKNWPENLCRKKISADFLKNLNHDDLDAWQNLHQVGSARYTTLPDESSKILAIEELEIGHIDGEPRRHDVSHSQVDINA